MFTVYSIEYQKGDKKRFKKDKKPSRSNFNFLMVSTITINQKNSGFVIIQGKIQYQHINSRFA